MSTSRRGLLLGAAGLFASRALAGDGLVSVPPPRHRPPARGAGPAAEPLDAIFARSGLGPATGFLLVDLDGGAVLEAQQADEPRPPASVQKMVTALYALETLGAGYRFETRLLATGPVVEGRLRGDLVLAGGGDPVLDTDALAALVAGLGQRGLWAVEGRFLVAEGALPRLGEIDATQPAEAAYNPGLGGMNLDFNRVYADWTAGGAGLSFRARGERFEVKVRDVRGMVSDDAVTARRLTDRAEIWSLPEAGMRRAGSLWLPVAGAGRHAGEVFRGLADQRGLSLPAVEVVDAAEGALLGATFSPPLGRVLRDMLRFSTNLTAEVVGLRASQARGPAPQSLADSAAAMTAWASARYGLDPAHLVNHSGLSGAARVTPTALIGMLRAAEGSGLPALLPEQSIRDSRNRPAGLPGVTVRSKTGTLDFASGLAGYLLGPRRLAFAILVADPARRDAIRPAQRSRPPGAEDWTARARQQAHALLRRWATLHAL